jgi:stringent starvation protein B
VDAFKSKREALLSFLDKGMTMIHLDARREGVIVPKHFVGQQDLRLNLSYRFAGSAMDVGDEKVEATLTFGGAPFRVVIPFSTVYALTSHVTGAGLVFPESLPDDVLAALRKEMELEPGMLQDGTVVETTQRPAAQAARAEMMPDAALAQAQSNGSPGRPTKAPHLRVIEGDKK